ncbi:hypothetical protein N7493_006897 [Penicillium malachiteum]|uniref:Uncharacterized protein n=1 Tax=Penicillium malachiteum TaxID=1324776 RepID=A0AAD6HJV1_9EURO|nr:hypothetical protein N7493_006897 [Penicillium malachiteum]
MDNRPPAWGLGIYHYPPPQDARSQHAAEMAHWNQALVEQLIQEAPIGNGIQAPPVHEVIRIANIPFTITRQEVRQSIPPQFHLLENCPIHIIMERSTGKTIDCFIELADPNSAAELVRWLNDGVHFTRVGSRRADITASNQGELMKALFPKAKCVEWSIDGEPSIRERYPDEMYSTGFTGFITQEELRCVLAYAEGPDRNTFTKKVLQRTYEALLSIVWKFPWHMTKLYTLRDRNQIFMTLRSMVELLVYKIENRHRQLLGLDGLLVSDLVHAALNCPGFNPRMKFCMVQISHRLDPGSVCGHLSPEALAYFPFDTLTWLHPFRVSALQFYGGLIGDGQTTSTLQAGLINRWADPRLLTPYGRQWYEWDVNFMTPGQKYADCIHYELVLLEALIRSGYHVRHAPILQNPYTGPSAMSARQPVRLRIDSDQNAEARARDFSDIPR